MQVVPVFDLDAKDVVDTQPFQMARWQRRLQGRDEHIMLVESMPHMFGHRSLSLPLEHIRQKVLGQEGAAPLLEVQVRLVEVWRRQAS